MDICPLNVCLLRRRRSEEMNHVHAEVRKNTKNAAEDNLAYYFIFYIAKGRGKAPSPVVFIICCYRKTPTQYSNISRNGRITYYSYELSTPPIEHRHYYTLDP